MGRQSNAEADASATAGAGVLPHRRQKKESSRSGSSPSPAQRLLEDEQARVDCALQPNVFIRLVRVLTSDRLSSARGKQQSEARESVGAWGSGSGPRRCAFYLVRGRLRTLVERVQILDALLQLARLVTRQRHQLLRLRA